MLVSIITLGCKVNQYESEGLANILKKNGVDVSLELTKADCYIINTCAVTNEAERKSRGIISKIKKLSTSAPIYLCGCSSQNNPNKFMEYENVAAVYGTSSKAEIAKLILQNKEIKDKIKIANCDISTVYEDDFVASGDRTRTVIKIQEGCNNFCSYCLIPYLRGRERSREISSVLSEVKSQAKTSNEITFTGINLSAYGADLSPKKSLKDIAILMCDYPNVRFKFSSLEQNIIDEDFIKTLKETENFAPHFHLSLQSGCDKTLKAMNRKYSSKDYFEKVCLIRKYFPLASITTDIIVGFPTETEEDFEACYNFAKKCKFSKMHIFPFSARSGTAAERMKNVATNVKKRATKLSLLDEKMHGEYIKLCKDNVFTCIIEQKKLGSDYYEGHIENYIKCYIKSAENLSPNTKLRVKIIKQYLDGALAEIVSY